MITNDGVVIQKEYDSQVQLSLTINYEGKVLSHSLPFTVIGYAYEIVADAFWNNSVLILLIAMTI